MSSLFQDQESLIAGLLTRKVGSDLHLFLEKVAIELDDLVDRIQFGILTMSGGKSPQIPCVLRPGAFIVLSLVDANGSFPIGDMAVAHAADRTLGNPGNFVALAVDTNDSVVGSDNATYGWLVINPP